jgi:hypothetical protein
MSDMCLAGKNKKKAKNLQIFFDIFLDYNLCFEAEGHKKRQKLSFNYFLLNLIAFMVIIAQKTNKIKLIINSRIYGIVFALITVLNSHRIFY